VSPLPPSTALPRARGSRGSHREDQVVSLLVPAVRLPKAEVDTACPHLQRVGVGGEYGLREESPKENSRRRGQKEVRAGFLF
jgi:hypothetical protein